MSNKIAKKIIFSRNKKVSTFVERLEGVIARRASLEEQIRYGVGVCLANKAIAAAFIKKVSQAHPQIGCGIVDTLKSRQVKSS